MILDIEIFKNQGPIKEATLVPLVFPLLAGAGSFTTLLSLRAEYANVNIVIALILNMIWVYFVVRMTARIERFFGKGGIYIIRKFFGIILLAISVRLFTVNINPCFYRRQVSNCSLLQTDEALVRRASLQFCHLFG